MMLNQLGRLSCLAFAVLALASQAGATGIDPGLILLSGSGQLEFSHFSIYTEGDIDDSDIAALTISATENGVLVTGPLSLRNRAEGAIQILYQVSVLSGPSVNGVMLSAATDIVDGGFPTFAKTAKLVYAGPIPELLSDAELLAELRTENFEDRNTTGGTAGFAAQTTLTMLDTIRLSSGGPGGVATFESVRNDFAFVPEPTTMLLLSGGLLGLVVLGSRSGPRRRA